MSTFPLARTRGCRAHGIVHHRAHVSRALTLLVFGVPFCWSRGSKASGHTSSVPEEAPAERGSQNGGDDAKKGDKNPVVDKSVDNHPFSEGPPEENKT